MKKYNFNEKELLSLFIAGDNELREVLKKPYTNNGFVFASDSHIMIRINPEILQGKYPECPKLRLDFPKNDLSVKISLKAIKEVLSELPKTDIEFVGDDIFCDECDADGNVYWEYQDSNGKLHEKSFACPICDGSGYIERKREIHTGNFVPYLNLVIGIGDVSYKACYVDIVCRAMEMLGVDEITLLHQGEYEIMLLQVDENIHIGVMPNLSEPDYELKL
ncbi:hypothetical protein [Bacteroides heparinolyticus]|uniref:hypothetical protein n=1 Tax=Prevotella heparinolytica TaxID=28113 RepID=UPI0023F30557|nr:hypothetical protein [Bacteroides heparinolyticus]